MWTHHEYEFNRIFAEDNLSIDGGTSIKRNVVLNHSGQAQFRRMFDQDQANLDFKHQQIDVPWTQLSTKYVWDIAEILTQQNSTKGYINLLKERMQDALWSWADLIEERGWSTPTDSSDDLFPYGIPYYLNKLDAGSTTGGFNGKTIRYGDTSTGTVCAGLDASLAKFARWRNYADVYTAVDNSLLLKMRKAFRLTKFKAPRIVSGYGQDNSSKRMVYMPGTAFDKMCDMAAKNDDSSTPADLMGGVRVRTDMNGNPYINGHPMMYIDNLDTDIDNAIYAVDWAKLKVVTQDGYWLEEGKPKNPSNAHTTFVVNVDGRCCILCTNRREAGFVMHNAIAA